MTQANDILRSNTSKLNVTLDSRQQQAATMAMIDFAARKVNESEKKSTSKPLSFSRPYWLATGNYG